MSLFGSLSSGVSGLLAQGESISVISDNLANVNTIGYKNTRTLFDQQVTSAGLSGTVYNSGGVGTEFQRFQSAQGAFLSTQSSTDLSLSGNGFFVVVDSNEISNDTSYFYSRAGAFNENNLGFLTTPTGQNLLGWRTESDGTITNIQNPAPVELQSVGSSARATAELDLGMNLTATETLRNWDTTTQTFAQNIDAILVDPGDQTTGADTVTDVRLFDSEGGARDVSIAFSKRNNNMWDWVMYTAGSNVTTDINGAAPAGAAANTIIGQGEIRFNTNGSLKMVTGENINIDWSGGVDQGSLDINFGDYTGGFSFDTATGVGALDPTTRFSQGVLDISIDENDPGAPVTVGGTYGFANLGLQGSGLYRIQVSDPAAGIYSVDIENSPTNRILEFANGVTMSVAAGFDVTTWAGGTMDVPVTAVAQKDKGAGTDGVLQFSSGYNVLFSNQDGFGSGTLAAVNVDQEGFVIGSFTNGESKKLWKVVVAVFQDPAELEPVGQNLLRETDASGRPLYKQAGVGGTATVVSGSLEQSTVDIANEFSNMIVAQRAFQASSTIISTVDQMLNELLQLR